MPWICDVAFPSFFLDVLAVMPAPSEITLALLAWYDRHRRDLPWRAKGDARPDPYAVWLSEVMLQQTTVAAVKGYYARFLARWPDVAALAGAPRDEVLAEWAGLGYYARARNLHDCARAVMDRCGGRFPETETALRELPGIGDYTAAAIAAIAFDEAATVVDGNVERVMTRLYAIDTPVPAARAAIRRLTAALVPRARPGDFAQATMDFGATLCTPKSPACTICPIRDACAARRAGTQTLYPKKPPKRALPQRYGAMAVITRPDGAVLVRTRPSKGLLGGMTEFVATSWEAEPGGMPDLDGLACRLEACGVVNHTFTHFALALDIYRGHVGTTEVPRSYRWVEAEGLRREPLPTVFARVYELATRSAVVAFDDAACLGLVGLEGADEQRRRQGKNRKA